MAKIYKVLVNGGSGSETKPISVMQGVGDKGSPVRIVAQKGVRYELQDEAKGKGAAPDQVRVKRVGKNLTLMFDGSKKPDVVVEDFYAVGSANDGNLPVLAGLAENGSVYEYIPQDPALNSVTPALADGNTPVLMALGGGALGDGFVLSALPLAAAAGGISGWAIAGAAVGAAALGGGGGGGGGGAAADTTAPSADSISGNLKQDETNDTGTKADDGITRNKTPVLVVKAETGATVDVVVNGKTYRATENTTTKGEYEVKISDALDDATYTPSITVTDAAGNKTTKNGVAFTVDNSAGTNPANGTSADKNPADQNSGDTTEIAITAVSEDTGSSNTDFITSDRSVLISGTVDYFYSTSGSVGDVVHVQIFDKAGKRVAHEFVTPNNGTWSMATPTTDLVDGDYALKADIVDAAGNTVKSAADQALKISSNYLSAVKDAAQAQEAGFDADKKVINTLNPTGNVLSNDTDVSAVGRVVTGAKVGGADALTEVAIGTSKENGLHLQGTYGELVIGANGTYQYIVDDSKANVLTGSDVKTETFTYAVKSPTGGTSSATLTVTLKGANDEANFDKTPNAEFAGVVPAGAETVSGTMTVSDADAGQTGFQTPPNLIGDYGSFTFTQTGGSGSWIYKVDRSKAAYAALSTGQERTDTLDITSFDGSASRTVTVTVIGVNDAPKLASVDGLAVSSENRNINPPAAKLLQGATRLTDLVGGITDVDNNFVKGIAVTSVSDQGVLWYSVDGGAIWKPATPTNSTISSGNALLLAADDKTYVYFQQTGGTSVGTSFTFKAWDKTSDDDAGTYADARSAGGATAFSADQQTVLVNDVFKIDNTVNPLSIDGGSGFDTLVLNGAVLNLDLTATGAVSLTSVERVDLTGTGNNTIKLNLDNLTQADVIGPVHTLFITGDAGDAVDLVKPEGWTVASTVPTQTVNNIAYNVYHLDSTHDLLIQQAITNVTFS